MIWRGGRVAEGAPLLREYARDRIVGSNPTLSAKLYNLGLKEKNTLCQVKKFQEIACCIIQIL
jgi:hypothetical protein